MLDGLNHIKDHLDGTLSYRWSCRMGICGSCGMTVNGEPKLTCATFLADYAPGPIRIEPLRNFPVIRDLIVDIGDFMRKLVPREAVDRSQTSRSRCAEGEYRQTPEELDEYKQFSMCINCMLCYAACPIYGLDPKFIGPAAIALAQRYNLDSRDEGASRAHGGALGARGHLGLHVRRRVHEGLPEACRSGRRDPALQADGSARVDESLLHAEGRVMSDTARLHAVSSALAPPAGIHLLVAGEVVLLPLHPARRAAACSSRGVVLYLLLLVRAVGGGSESYHAFLDWSRDAVGARA